MNIYPAIKARMGSWQYYIVKMSMREICGNVRFGTDIHDDRTLDQTIQRIMNESRVKTDLVTYLRRQDDRFFSSIVVAALRGNPKWYPVTMEAESTDDILSDDERLNQSFGILKFDGTQDYYALDGQHRLAAIKALVDPNSELAMGAPKDFKNEEISVIVVVPSETDTKEEFLVRYRRLFGNLNRYAKPTDAVTNIIMDEDDVFAIITRRLITEHDFFKWSGKQSESTRVKTQKGKNLNQRDSYFTSLETLYAVNRILLNSRERQNNGWPQSDETDYKTYMRHRPDEEIIDQLFEELKIYWDALLDELPVLYEDPSKCKDHSARMSDESNTKDIVLFWPIGQELLAKIARSLLDKRQMNANDPTPRSVSEALSGLNRLTWEFHRLPWRNLLLIPADNIPDSENWKIRSEDRKRALQIAEEIIAWQIGLIENSAEDLCDLRTRWSQYLLPALSDSEIEDLWLEIQDSIINV